MAFKSLYDIVQICEHENAEFWEIVIEEDIKERMVTREESFEKMTFMYHTMKEAITNYDNNLISESGLVGGDGFLMEQAIYSNKMLCGEFINTVMSLAIKMAESNSCMKRIVAAPTAGSCGVLPAVCIAYEKFKNVDERKMVKALYVAAAIGEVIDIRASISGAEGGCQAEVGTASAMAAGAVTYLQGGDNRAIVHAAAIALKNLLGLVCDPVAGLVEVPCVKRNVIGAVNALAAADMAMAGIRSRIPPDEVIDAMGSVGDLMNINLKETGKGGLAATSTGKDIAYRLRRK